MHSFIFIFAFPLGAAQLRCTTRIQSPTQRGTPMCGSKADMAVCVIPVQLKASFAQAARSAQKRKKPQRTDPMGLLTSFWRRRRESNPRCGFWPTCSLSRGVPSTTRPRLRCCVFLLSFRRSKIIAGSSAQVKQKNKLFASARDFA